LLEGTLEHMKITVVLRYTKNGIHITTYQKLINSTKVI